MTSFAAGGESGCSCPMVIIRIDRSRHGYVQPANHLSWIGDAIQNGVVGQNAFISTPLGFCDIVSAS